MSYNGFLNVLKPSGPTASDVVVKIKRLLNQKKVGHLGTLDPGAAGVLPIAIGKGAKLFDVLVYKDKKYRAYFTFGKTTDTLDSYGKVIKQKSFCFTQEQLIQATQSLVGKIKQIPPQYSALSVGGVRAYDLARSGKNVQLTAREVTIKSFEVIRRVSQDTWCFDIVCSGGTYIRSIARDVAQALGTVAYMSLLIRQQSGAFCIDDAVTLEELEKNAAEHLLDLEYPLKSYKTLILPQKYLKMLKNGVKLTNIGKIDNTITDIDLYKVYCDGIFFGLGQKDDQNRFVVKYRLDD